MSDAVWKIPSDRRLVPTDKLFEFIKALSIIIDAVFTAIGALRGQGTPKPGSGNIVRVNCNQVPFNIILPLGDPMNSVITGVYPAFIDTKFVPHQPPPIPTQRQASPFPIKLNTQTTMLSFMYLITPIFVDFWEKYRPWIEDNQPKGKPDLWENPLNFARMVRNWISHHHGHVFFRYPAEPNVSWHGLSYSYADNGKKVIDGDLGMGDLIVLLFEISDTLDRLGCPVNP